MHDGSNKSAATLKYRVGEITKTTPPDADSGGEWYSYTIEHDKSRIDGMRSGSLSAVTRYLEDYVEELNARATSGYSAYAPKKKA
jgi:hypothetical protein